MIIYLHRGVLRIPGLRHGFLADPLSITMALFVSGIGALIHLYSIGYMHGDPKFSKFFLYLNLFAFSMLMLVPFGRIIRFKPFLSFAHPMHEAATKFDA